MTYKGWTIYARVDVTGSTTGYLNEKGEVEDYDYDYETDLGDIYEYWARNYDTDEEIWEGHETIDGIKKEIRRACREQKERDEA